MASKATAFAAPAINAEKKLRVYIREQVTLRSQPAKLRKLFLRLSRDHRGRFDFLTFREALLKIGCRQDVVDINKQEVLKRVFASCASHGRMSWSGFSGKLLVMKGEDSTIEDTFTGRLKYGCTTNRAVKRMEYRAQHQHEIRSGGAQFFVKIFTHRVLQRAFTYPSLEALLKRNDGDRDGNLTMGELNKSLVDIGIHDCSPDDILLFAKSMSITTDSILIPIEKIVDLVFADPSKQPGAGAVFFSGGGSRTHERDVSVQPKGVHVAVNLVRERICKLPGMDKPGGISLFFDSIDPDGDGEVDKLELQHALKNLLKISSKDLHAKDIRGLFERLDLDGSHSIDKMEFVAFFGLPAERQTAKDEKANGTTHISSNEIVAKQQERARDQLLMHVRERVSLLCRRRGLKDLWITKMCQGMRRGRLNRAGFKAGLRHLGCRGFGPGDADLLFDFCVAHAEGNDLHSDGHGHYDIGFTSFSRVFSPDTFRSVRTDAALRHRQKHELGVLPCNPEIPIIRKPILNLDPNPIKEHAEAYSVSTLHMARMVREKAWNVARSSAMGSSAVTNPNNLAKIIKRYTSNPKYITMKEFLTAARDINGLDLKNCVASDLECLYRVYVSEQNKTQKMNNNDEEGSTTGTVLTLQSFVTQVVPKGINEGEKSSITSLFTGNVKTYDHPTQPYIPGQNGPIYANAPWGIYESKDKHMLSNSQATIGADSQRQYEHIIHGRPNADTGIFFNTGESAGDSGADFATRTTKDGIGKNCTTGARVYYDVQHGGGFYEGIKQPKYGEHIGYQKKCKPTMSGIVNFPNKTHGHTLMSESSAGFGQTARENWSDFRINPKKRRDATLKLDIHYRERTTGAPYAMDIVPRRPTTPLRPTSGSSSSSSSRRRKGSRKLISKPETISDVSQLQIQSTVPNESSTAKSATTSKSNEQRPASAASIQSVRSTMSQRQRRVANLTRKGPNLQANQKYVPIMSKSKGSFPSPRINKMKALQAVQQAMNAQKKRSGVRPRSRQGARSSTKRSFVPVVAMVRPAASSFRGLHFKT